MCHVTLFYFITIENPGRNCECRCRGSLFS